jgi:hypothetical protein
MSSKAITGVDSAFLAKKVPISSPHFLHFSEPPLSPHTYLPRGPCSVLLTPPPSRHTAKRLNRLVEAGGPALPKKAARIRFFRCFLKIRYRGSRVLPTSHSSGECAAPSRTTYVLGVSGLGWRSRTLKREQAAPRLFSPPPQGWPLRFNKV